MKYKNALAYFELLNGATFIIEFDTQFRISLTRYQNKIHIRPIVVYSLDKEYLERCGMDKWWDMDLDNPDMIGWFDNKKWSRLE